MNPTVSPSFLWTSSFVVPITCVHRTGAAPRARKCRHHVSDGAADSTARDEPDKQMTSTDNPATDTRATRRTGRAVARWERDEQLHMVVTADEAVARTAGHKRFSEIVACFGDSVITDNQRVDLRLLACGELCELELPTLVVTGRHQF